MKQNQIQNIFLFLFFLFLSSETTAQDGTDKPKAQFYGFIRNEFFYDSYKGVDANIIILDRLWKPSLTLAEAKRFVMDLKHKNTCFIYHLDDNIIDTNFYSGNEKKEIADLFLRSADGLILSKASTGGMGCIRACDILI